MIVGCNIQGDRMGLWSWALKLEVGSRKGAPGRDEASRGWRLACVGCFWIDVSFWAGREWSSLLFSLPSALLLQGLRCDCFLSAVSGPLFLQLTPMPPLHPRAFLWASCQEPGRCYLSLLQYAGKLKAHLMPGDPSPARQTFLTLHPISSLIGPMGHPHPFFCRGCCYPVALGCLLVNLLVSISSVELYVPREQGGILSFIMFISFMWLINRLS